MSILELGALGQFVGSIGVIATLIYLAIQVRQNTKMMTAQISQSRTDTAISDQRAVYNSDHMPALLVKAYRGDELTDEERVRYVHYFRGFNRNVDNQLFQHRLGLLSSNIPRSVADAARAVIAGQALGLELWEQQKRAYTDEYVAFIEKAISDLRNVQ